MLNTFAHLSSKTDIFDSTKRPQISENALKILKSRGYLWMIGDDQETPLEMFNRVACTIAGAERTMGHPELVNKYHEVFLEMLTDLRFIPNTPTLINAGRDRGLLVACLVLPISDSMEGIMDCIKAQAIVQKSGSGCGFSFGPIRESGARISTTGMKAVGPIPIIKLMNYMMENFIVQGGVRHGANMGILPCDHPDIEEFISFKHADKSCPSFNISVGITDDFMRAVLADGMWPLKSRVGGHTIKTMRAVDLFNKIVENAWESGDPGVVFLDTINRANPTPNVGDIEATNACGEQPLLPYEGCTLGHLNLAKYYCPTLDCGPEHFNMELFRSDIYNAIRFLDNVVEISYYPLREIENMHRYTNRKIGLGVMGLADLFLKMGISYASSEAQQLSNKIASRLRMYADLASSDLGQERGSFPAFVGSRLQGLGWRYMRNACRTTVAPTGSSAIIANASTSIEPVFAFILEREQAGMKMREVHPALSELLATKTTEEHAAIVQYYLEHGTFQGCAGLSHSEQAILVQANDISPTYHVDMQAIWQQHIDSAISKTTNLPSSATTKDIADIYMQAWRSGCKGITVYRNGCRSNEPLKQVKNTMSAPEVSVEHIGADDFNITDSSLCPECQHQLDMGGGCETCKNCGYAACHI